MNFFTLIHVVALVDRIDGSKVDDQLWEAVERDYTGKIRGLVDIGADVNCRDTDVCC